MQAATGVDKRPDAKAKVKWQIAIRPGKPAAEHGQHSGCPDGASRKAQAGIRAKVEHQFRVNKRQFGYLKPRYLNELLNGCALALRG
jgi:IS5 family transposase